MSSSLTSLQDKIKTQGSKRVGCTICEEVYTCRQNLEKHKELDYVLNALFR